MTKEQVIKELRICECYSVLPSVEALDMAIKALEQEETNKDTDFVPVEIEFIGKKGSGYLYKPQQLIVTGYYTLDAFEHFGGKYKEKEEVKNG